jgi:hypothetical protein
MRAVFGLLSFQGLDPILQVVHGLDGFLEQFAQRLLLLPELFQFSFLGHVAT